MSQHGARSGNGFCFGVIMHDISRLLSFYNAIAILQSILRDYACRSNAVCWNKSKNHFDYSEIFADRKFVAILT